MWDGAWEIGESGSGANGDGDHGEMGVCHSEEEIVLVDPRLQVPKLALAPAQTYGFAKVPSLLCTARHLVS